MNNQQYRAMTDEASSTQAHHTRLKVNHGENGGTDVSSIPMVFFITLLLLFYVMPAFLNSALPSPVLEVDLRPWT